MLVVLDGLAMTDRSAAHDHLAQQLALPAHYGRNLDALYDVLTEYRKDVTIRIEHLPQLLTALGRYGENLVKTIRDAAQKNPHLHMET